MLRNEQLRRLETDPAVRDAAQHEVDQLQTVDREASGTRAKLARALMLMSALAVSGLEMLPGRAEAATPENSSAADTFTAIKADYQKFDVTNRDEIQKQLAEFEASSTIIAELPALDQVEYYREWAFTTAQVVENFYVADPDGVILAGTLDMNATSESRSLATLQSAQELVQKAEAVIAGIYPDNASEIDARSIAQLKLRDLSLKISTTVDCLHGDDPDVLKKKTELITTLRADLEKTGYSVTITGASDLKSARMSLQVELVKGDKHVSFMLGIDSHADGAVAVNKSMALGHDEIINAIINGL